MNSRLILPTFSIIMTATVVFGLQAFAATFVEPSSAPPTNNRAAPLDTSVNTNDKPGTIATNNFLSRYDTYLATNSGNVGIGNTSPTKKLDVNGGVKGSQFCLGTNCITEWPGGASSVIGPLLDYNGLPARNQVYFYMPVLADALITAHANVVADIGGAMPVQLFVDGTLRRTAYYGEECGKACSGGLATVTLVARQTLSVGSHLLEVTASGRASLFGSPNSSAQAVQFIVQILK